MWVVVYVHAYAYEQRSRRRTNIYVQGALLFGVATTKATKHCGHVRVCACVRACVRVHSCCERTGDEANSRIDAALFLRFFTECACRW